MLRAINESLVNQIDQTTFLVKLRSILSQVIRSGALTGLALIDLRNFNRISTRLGYQTSDSVLLRFGMNLAAISKHDQNVFRLGEHKFAVLLHDLKNRGHAVLAGKKIERLAREPIKTSAGNVTLDVATGIALFPEQAESAEGLLQRAELALASAEEGEVQVHIYSPGITQEIASLWGMENDLKSAIENDEFELHYQPKIDLRNNRPVGAEALLRWKSAKRGPVPPDIFVPVAEKAGIIHSLTWYALNTALRQSAAWPKEWGALTVAVNVSAMDIRDAEFVDFICEAVGIWGGVYQRLTLEITESAIIADPDSSFDKLNKLRKKGVRIAIDDFGTGYSSLSYFKNIPADEIKIDRSFVAGMLNDKSDRKIVRSIIDLAHDFEIPVVAEGLEDAAMLRMLRELRCDYAQGFLYERPLTDLQFIRWINSYQPGSYP